MNTKFTKGPWRINGIDMFELLGGDEEGDRGCYPIANIRGGDWGYYSEAEANLALIASAPELYEALENALPYLWSHKGQGARRAEEIAEAALKKARGEA